MDGCMYGCMDGYVDGCVDVCVCGWIDRLTEKVEGVFSQLAAALVCAFIFFKSKVKQTIILLRCSTVCRSPHNTCTHRHQDPFFSIL